MICLSFKNLSSELGLSDNATNGRRIQKWESEMDRDIGKPRDGSLFQNWDSECCFQEKKDFVYHLLVSRILNVRPLVMSACLGNSQDHAIQEILVNTTRFCPSQFVVRNF